MMTPSEVAAQLVARGCGKNEEKVERVLTDWRTKHLMPKLTKRGRGRGLGRLNYWIQTDIFDQAIAVFGLFDANQPTDAVLVGIWLLGFDVPISDVPVAWLRLVDTKLEGRVRAKLAKGQKQADIMTDATQAGIRRASRTFGVERSKIEFAALEISDMIFDRAYQFDEVANEAINICIRACIHTFGNRSPMIGKIDFRPEINFFHANQSLKGMKYLISSSSYDELISARDLWLRIWKVVRKFLPGLQTRAPSRKLSRDQYWSIVCGRHAIPAILHLIRMGHTSRLERTLQLIEDAHGKFNPLGECAELLFGRELNPSVKVLISGLMELWNYPQSRAAHIRN